MKKRETVWQDLANLPIKHVDKRDTIGFETYKYHILLANTCYHNAKSVLLAVASVNKIILVLIKNILYIYLKYHECTIYNSRSTVPYISYDLILKQTHHSSCKEVMWQSKSISVVRSPFSSSKYCWWRWPGAYSSFQSRKNMWLI